MDVIINVVGQYDYCLICKGKEDLKTMNKIYKNLGMSITFSDLLMKCFSIQFLDKHCGKENMICLKCIEKIKFCVNFRKQVETAHKLLYDAKKEKIDPDYLRKEVVERIRKFKAKKIKKVQRTEIKNNALDMVIKQEVLDEQNSDDEPIINLKNCYNSTNYEYFNDNDDVSFQNEDEDSDSSVKTGEILRATGFKELIKKIRQQESHSIPKLDPGQKECPVCGKDFPDSYLLKKHHTEHYPSFICHVCGLSFTKQFFYKRHLNTHFEKNFGCDLCDKKYLTHEAMQKHRQVNHFNHLPFICYHCNKRFKYGLLKKKHLMSAHGIKCKMFKCPECEEEFFTPHYMESHLKKKHYQLKEHKCVACNTAFYSQRDLKKHYMVKHEGIKSHKCDICNKSFSYSRGLRTHRKIHLNQRDHVCQVCGAAFVQTTSLKYHIRTHHPDAAT